MFRAVEEAHLHATTNSPWWLNQDLHGANVHAIRMGILSLTLRQVLHIIFYHLMLHEVWHSERRRQREQIDNDRYIEFMAFWICLRPLSIYQYAVHWAWFQVGLNVMGFTSLKRSQWTNDSGDSCANINQPKRWSFLRFAGEMIRIKMLWITKNTSGLNLLEQISTLLLLCFVLSW